MTTEEAVEQIENVSVWVGVAAGVGKRLQAARGWAGPVCSAVPGWSRLSPHYS